MYNISKTGSEKASSSIAIIGSARSGTTIVGKIVGSFVGVEYFFEPELLFSLIANKSQMSDVLFMNLYESYIYEDLFVNAISGRKLNLRESDDSCIYFSQARDEVRDRLSAVVRKNDFSTANRICYKIPDFTDVFGDISKIYPRMKTLQVVRDPISTINSLMDKAWFSDENLLGGINIWPLDSSCQVPKPHWARGIMDDDWVAFSQLERCCYYYRSQTVRLSGCNNLVVKYADLVMDPFSTTEKMADHIGAVYSKNTREVLLSVDNQSTTNKRPNKYMDSKTMRDLTDLYEGHI